MYKLLLTSCSFIIASLVVIAAFITATTYIQLAVAILLYPLLVFFAYKVFPYNWRHLSKKPVTANQPPLQGVSSHPAKVETTKIENVGITDIDKRVFLKLIGGAGLSLFLFSLFNKKGESLFPGIAPAGPGLTLLKDSAGNKIDPAQNQPMDGYRISEIDDNVISFYGFTKKDGAWFIMREDSDTGSFRYSRGEGNFPGSWTNRENLKYDYYANIF